MREAKQRLNRLYRAERLATAGTVAASLAHEIRNPMTAIRSGIQMLRDEAALSRDGKGPGSSSTVAGWDSSFPTPASGS